MESYRIKTTPEALGISQDTIDEISYNLKKIIDKHYHSEKIDIYDEYQDYIDQEEGEISRLWPSASYHGIRRLSEQLSSKFSTQSIIKELLATHRFPDLFFRSIFVETYDIYLVDSINWTTHVANLIQDIVNWKKGFREILDVRARWDKLFHLYIKQNERFLEKHPFLDRTEIKKCYVGLSNTEDIKYNMSIPTGCWYLSGQFNVLGGEILCHDGATRYVGPTSYYIFAYIDNDTNGLLLGRIEGRRTTDMPINPHINSGRGGKVCLGGYNMEISSALLDRDFATVAQLIQNFQFDYDPDDYWGRGITSLPKIYDIPDSTSKAIDWPSPVFGYKSLSSVLKGPYYLRGNKIVSHDEWVTCAITGKVIRRDNAERLPVYVSKEGLRFMSRNPSVVSSELRYCLNNKWDKARIDAKIDSAWDEKRKRDIPRLYEEALKREEYLQNQLEAVKKYILEGHGNYLDVARLNTRYSSERQKYLLNLARDVAF